MKYMCAAVLLLFSSICIGAGIWRKYSEVPLGIIILGVLMVCWTLSGGIYCIVRVALHDVMKDCK